MACFLCACVVFVVVAFLPPDPVVCQAPDDDERDDPDERDGDEDDARLDPAGAPFRAHRRAARPGVAVIAADVARVELVDVELAVEAEIVGVRPQEALDVGLRRERLEPLLLERAQVLDADLRRQLGLR